MDIRLVGLMCFEDNILIIDPDAKEPVNASGSICVIYKGKLYNAVVKTGPAKPVTSMGLPLVQFEGSFIQRSSWTLSDMLKSVVNDPKKAKEIENELLQIKTSSKYKEVKIDDA